MWILLDFDFKYPKEFLTWILVDMGQIVPNLHLVNLGIWLQEGFIVGRMKLQNDLVTITKVPSGESQNETVSRRATGQLFTQCPFFGRKDSCRGKQIHSGFKVCIILRETEIKGSNLDRSAGPEV